jgi:protein-L-isoaspartate(D-aspartate) O-methyltransferase
MEEGIQKQLDQMVSDLRSRGYLRTEAVAQAFGAVPRHQFLPLNVLERAYVVDEAIPTHFDNDGIPISSSSAPSIMAIMLEMLDVRPGQLVLEIGAGTGYNAALIARLVGASGRVTSIDVDQVVASEAQAHLTAVGPYQVQIVVGDGWMGMEGATFDRIMVTAECWDISPCWVSQLREGGLLVLPLWIRPGLTLAVAFEKVGKILESCSLAYCGFMPLRGPHRGPPREATVPAWPDATGANEQTRWIAVFDDASNERVKILERLLGELPSISPAPPLVPGWNVRVALGEPDSIVFFGVGGKSRSAFGLFDARHGSLSVVEGDRLISYGNPVCRQRLEKTLTSATSLDLLEELHIEAVPHSALERNGPIITRPSFDLMIREVPRPL